MPAHKPDAFDHLMKFALTMSDEDIFEISNRLLAEGVKQNLSDDADYVLAGCLERGFIPLRQGFKDVAAGKFVPLHRER